MDLKKICIEAASIARNTGIFIASKQAQISQTDVREKERNSLVTFVDESAERMLVGELALLVPEAGFLTEENTIPDSGQELKWIIDPLDGTTNFIHHIPCYSVSVALIQGKQLLAGVVHEVSKDENFYAWKGGGAYLNDRPIRVSSGAVLRDSVIATGFPHAAQEYLEEYIRIFRKLMTGTRAIRRMGSAAADLAYVACGRFDGFFEYALNPWDVAAGALIVQEAGGRVADFAGGGDFIHGKQIIAGTPAVFHELHRVIERERKAEKA